MTTSTTARSERAQPTTSEVSGFLLELHEGSNEVGHHELQRLALERFSEMIPFDSGLLAMGTIQGGVPYGHDVVLHDVSPELMASWDAVKHEDRVAEWAFAHPGRTGNFVVAGPIFEGCEAMLAHCRHFRLAHVLCTSMIAPDTGLYWVMSTYRADPDRPFREEERSATEIVVPHIFSAARRARIMQLRTRAKLEVGLGQSAAIANEGGLVLEAEPTFAELLRSGFPGWSGPMLPAEVFALFASGASARLARGKIVLRADPAQGVFLLDVRRALPADALTTRERVIADAFSLGETHREIGARFGVSPNTVRRHLANIYEKLGISSKAELERMLSGAR